MRKIITTLLLITLLAAIAYTGYCAWIAYGTPPRAYQAFRQHDAPECAAIPVTGNAFKGSRWECEQRLVEADLLRQNPGVVAREGDSLAIFYRGQLVSRLSPVEPDGTIEACDAYHAHHMISVYDPSSQALEKLPEIVCHFGEFDRRFLALPDGGRWDVASVQASADGHQLATGSNSWDATDGHNRFTVYDWPLRRVVARFRPSCRALSWQDATHLTVTCLQDLTVDHPRERLLVQGLAFDARVWKDDSGAWQMQATRWGRALGYNDVDDLELQPIFSLRPLPHFTAAKVKGAPVGRGHG